MIDCNICKHKEDYYYCTECRHGELFERKNVSEPKKISVSNGREYCGHCGYLCEYARGYKKFYCIRCGGLNLRSWNNMSEKDFSYLKPTDPIIVVRDGNKKVRQVEKITPSGLIRVSGVLYYPDGRERTSSIWHSSRLIPYNKETALVIEQDEFISKLVKRLHNININSITFEQATAISNVLDKKSLT